MLRLCHARNLGSFLRLPGDSLISMMGARQPRLPSGKNGDVPVRDRAIVRRSDLDSASFSARPCVGTSSQHHGRIDKLQRTIDGSCDPDDAAFYTCGCGVWTKQ